VDRHRDRNAAAEEDFEETIGDLVRYYATLPPGGVEASVREQVTAEIVPERVTTQQTRTPAQRSPWVWVLGGAASMVLGGVVTFALIVGRPDFWRVAEEPVVSSPKITVAGPPPSKSADGIPKAVPLAEPVGEALADAPATKPGSDAVVETAARPAVKAKPVKKRRAKRSMKRARARRVVRRRAAPVAARRKPAPAPAGGGGDDWADPYK
jgi:hypothetical protein